MNRSYRLKANIGSDQVLNVNLKQDIDIYEILTLKLGKDKFSQNGVSVKNMYKTHSAGYGVIVGRVLANDAFGVPNAKVSVFIPLSKEDKASRRDIRAIYPFNFVTDVDKRNVKYNTLPNYKRFECHQPVGSFPNKRLILDEDSVLELYDKYYKYTTITNEAGDYMIFGVPTGEQILHIDVDLSDIGILSQEPRDFIYKGYSINLFESPTQFKRGTNLDDLPQIQNQSTSVTVYPLWGDKNSDEIAITRKDITLQYKFEPTCVFMGSVITDNGMNSISHNCVPDEGVGEAEQLVPSKGDIEMIRKTVDDKVEEFQIKGNQLIDADGTWCYQIPMNLDYVGMDEYGNIVPTNNPNKGIPTRTRVRFRITLDESSSESITTHKARYLIPNNPDLYEGHIEPHVHQDVIDKDLYYEFGTLTPDECFRDLYWNKVYSIKNYIPRVQMSRYETTTNYLAIKGVNKRGAKENNLIPYNKLNANLTIPAFSFLRLIGATFHGFWLWLRRYTVSVSDDETLEKAVEQTDGISLDFYNDWLNGCLYFPSWFWRVRKNKEYKKGESVYESTFCECKKDENVGMPSYLYLFNSGSLVYNANNDDLELVWKNSQNELSELYSKEFNNRFTTIPYGSRGFFGGLIKKMTNKDGADAFYYAFGNKLILTGEKENVKSSGNSSYNDLFPDQFRPSDDEVYYKYVRLFSTDIILLGSLRDCDLDGVPRMQYNLPSTTAVIPPIGKYKSNTYISQLSTDDDSDEKKKNNINDDESEFITYNGMNWGKIWHTQDMAKENALRAFLQLFGIKYDKNVEYKYKYGSGLFFGIAPYDGDVNILTDIKTPINVERLCELGVTYDSDVFMDFNGNGSYYYSEMDGLITKREIEDVESRALFASLNHNKLIGTVENYNTGYKKYDLTNLYPSNFDGRFEEIAEEYTVDATNEAESEQKPISNDFRCKDYIDFRLGNNTVKNKDGITLYRGLSLLYNGRKKLKTGIRFDNAFLIGNNNVRYTLGDGAVRINRYKTPRRRHFYGVHKRSNEMVYPMERLYGSTIIRPLYHVFPLYNNSFYFYFGLKQGSTAIDKFYEQFYSECKEINTDPFRISIDTRSSRACEVDETMTETGGTITVLVEEIELPCTIDVRKKSTGKSVRYFETAEAEITIDGLENDKYVVVITDAFGNFMEEDVTLRQEKIELEAPVTRSIMTEYFNQTTEEIYRSDAYGRISFNNYTIYGERKEITNLEGSGGVYKVNNEIKITINSEFGEFGDYIYAPNEKDDNVVNICKPGTFTIEVRELCNNGNIECNNVSYYMVNVHDVKNIEMYLNGVPSKYIIGPLKMNSQQEFYYNEYFHDKGESVDSITSTTINGWFGVHNPDIYSELFKHAITEDSDDIEATLWARDIGSSEPIDILKSKFNYMFKLSSGAYVTTNNKNSFSVKLGGASGNLLLRSAMPIYENFDNKYVTGNRKVVVCNDKYPNIVSENYDGAGAGYQFNPKYTVDNVKNTGNYFAGFSNNANILQLDSENCMLLDTDESYQTIPYGADPITELCLSREVSEIKAEVNTTKKYFRTEFIDRRFDYDAIVITGHKCNHFGEDREDTWSEARFSALTYNGIEMLYVNDKSIVSTGEDTEYKYDLTNSEVKLNVTKSKRKRFYSTKLYYGNNNYIDLVNAFDYNCTSNPSVEGAHLLTGHSKSPSSNFDFFGFYGDSPSVHGYPMKRWLDINEVPYSDRYTFTNVSCGYDGIEVKNDDSITAYAVPGETVSFTVDGNEIVNIVPVEYGQDKYNIWFNGDNGAYTAGRIEELEFRIIPDYVDDNFETRTTSIKVCNDNASHSALVNLKSSLASPSIDGISVPTLNVIDTTEEFKNHTFKVSNQGISGEFLFFAIDRTFKSTANDFLKKGLRVINTSTIYNISGFSFTHVSTTQVDYTATIPPGGINVDTSGSGSGSGTGTATNGDETYPVSVTVGVTTNGSGTNEEEVEGTMKKDYCTFMISSRYLASCLSDMRFNITIGGVTANYSVGNGVSIISSTSSSIQIGILLSQHNKLISEAGVASLRGFFKISDEIKASNGDGYLVFAFDCTFR